MEEPEQVLLYGAIFYFAVFYPTAPCGLGILLKEMGYGPAHTILPPHYPAPSEMFTTVIHPLRVNEPSPMVLCLLVDNEEAALLHEEATMTIDELLVRYGQNLNAVKHAAALR